MRTIRPATTSDIPGIAQVCEAAFAEQIEPEVCRRQIADPTIDLHVAVEGNEVAGFVSAFALDGAADNPWFVDSLAVRPQSQGRGYGRHLIESTWTTARRHGFRMSCALIRADNAPSQLCFAHCGYATDRRPHSLYIWPPQSGAANSKTDPVRLLPVDTITYRGLWIEGLADASTEIQRRAVQQARAYCAREGRGSSGALITDPSRLDVALLEQAELKGEYYWWTITL
ncbi:MAG: GNAT family N-acetyltransferase [Gemmatimonadota bacterium]|nr:GNAT family N-acetyltransferase [Gemmatimonadota bacterium]